MAIHYTTSSNALMSDENSPQPSSGGPSCLPATAIENNKHKANYMQMLGKLVK